MDFVICHWVLASGRILLVRFPIKSGMTGVLVPIVILAKAGI